jgi:hypothetical protein
MSERDNLVITAMINDKRRFAEFGQVLGDVARQLGIVEVLTILIP